MDEEENEVGSNFTVDCRTFIVEPHLDKCNS